MKEKKEKQDALTAMLLEPKVRSLASCKYTMFSLFLIKSWRD
jgi:hypothetical protein